ncbi:hypothetical protein GUJ93_ZPchr0010g8117 [Zizania palustris]|uniref:Trehalose 6-phosphate phosphatase n=1 Tax=Zizania palustris TaxID=103762 RepID=A0A8J6BQ54_ZIZPA|nr:hypothetical protein GUJ93_ZPchr0010g8117 [Zizania palustris]
MTGQSMVMPEVVAVLMPPNTAPLFACTPPRAAPGVAVRKKYMQAQMDIGPGRINGWVESMRASSPTHAKAAAVLAAGAGAVDGERAAWMVRHPSALSKFDQIVAASKGKKIVMFLDYDGTLSPIVDDPDAAFMSDTMRRAVRSVAKHFPTAIVSGRCRDKVFEFVKLAELYYAGSHGMDIKSPAKASRHNEAKAKGVLFQPASKFLPMIEQSWSTLAGIVKGELEEYPKLKLTQGRKVLEIRPTIKWDKGKALEFLLESLGFADCTDVLPVYIGDDRSDEDAFKVLQKRGHGGVGIVVSKYPKDTHASYSLQEPAEVMEFLLRLVEWERLSRAQARPKCW